MSAAFVRTWLFLSAIVAAQLCTTATRHYCLAAEDVTWDYAPSPRDLIHGAHLPPAVGPTNAMGKDPLAGVHRQHLFSAPASAGMARHPGPHHACGSRRYHHGRIPQPQPVRTRDSSARAWLRQVYWRHQQHPTWRVLTALQMDANED